MENKERKFTCNWYVYKSTLYLEVKKSGRGPYNMPVTYYKYISEHVIK